MEYRSVKIPDDIKIGSLLLFPCLFAFFGLSYVLIALTKINSKDVTVETYHVIILVLFGILVVGAAIYIYFKVIKIYFEEARWHKTHLITFVILSLAFGLFLFGVVEPGVEPTPISKPTPIATPTPIAAPTPIATPTRAEISITYPSNSATVQMNEIITGTAKNIPDDQQLWIVIYPQSTYKYYPQNPVNIQGDGSWTLPVQFGRESNVGTKFDIVALLADKNAQKELNYYMDTSAKNGSYSGMGMLPDGTIEITNIRVTRV
jgi:hypothetical protein